MERLKQEGTSHSSSDLLKINVKMDDSWTAQALRAGWRDTVWAFGFPYLLSPEDFAYIFFTDLDYRLRNSRGREGRMLMAVLWDGQSGCGVSDQAFVFETYSKNCSGLQPVVDWPQC